MKLKSIIKKCAAIALAGSIFFASANMFVVQASTINETSVSKPNYGYANISSGTLNVRQSANASSSIVASLSKNTMMMIVGQDGNFYKIQYNSEGNYGYVSKDYVLFGSADFYLQANTSGGNLIMRSYAGTSYDQVDKIPNGRYFAHVKTINGWHHGVHGIKNGYTSGEYTNKFSF